MLPTFSLTPSNGMTSMTDDATHSTTSEPKEKPRPAMSFASKPAMASTPYYLRTPKPSLHSLINDIGPEDTYNFSTLRCTITAETATTQLPLSQSDKIRRIIHVDRGSVASVSMRGSVELFDVEPLSAKKGGVSTIASMIQPMQFATGGYDHVVHLWDVKADLSSASPRPLAIKHTSQVQSLLAIRDTSHKLVSAGADCNVHFWDLSSERVVNTLRPSNATYHLHSMTSPFCTLLEVHEAEQRYTENNVRKQARYDLARRGIIATETEIAKWKRERTEALESE
ncbi:hypothetical protein C0991_005967 [Blastosporella zonata]|nr:hypothetical protein C0991_005967 [Blastosporella zonata]